MRRAARMLNLLMQTGIWITQILAVVLFVILPSQFNGIASVARLVLPFRQPALPQVTARLTRPVGWTEPTQQSPTEKFRGQYATTGAGHVVIGAIQLKWLTVEISMFISWKKALLVRWDIVLGLRVSVVKYFSNITYATICNWYLHRLTI